MDQSLNSCLNYCVHNVSYREMFLDESIYPEIPPLPSFFGMQTRNGSSITDSGIDFYIEIASQAEVLRAHFWNGNILSDFFLPAWGTPPLMMD